MTDPTSRTYWVGLPVGITVSDDGTLRVEVDMSDASSEMRDVWYDAEEMDWDEAQALTDGAVVDAHPGRSSGADVTIPRAVAEMHCPARYDCPFRTFIISEMVVHLTDPDERHGDS